MLMNRLVLSLCEPVYKAAKMLVFYPTRLFNTCIIRNFCVVITGRCNARCKMCDIWSSDSATTDLPLEKLEEILKSRCLKHVKAIGVTGGEPFLRKDIHQVYNTIRDYFPLAKVTISTNGLLQKEIITFFKNISPCYKTDFIISMDGVREHDAIRGVKWAFDQVLSTLRAVKENFPEVNIVIKFTICPWNYNEILDVYELSKRENVQFLIKVVDNIKSYTSQVNHKKNKKRFAFDKEKKEAIISYLRIIQADQLRKGQFRSCIFTKELISYFSKKGYNLPHCTLPFYSAFITQNGIVYGCRRFRPIGNIYQNSLDSILSSKKKTFDYRACKNCVSNYGFYNSLI